jgi:hypothetical protein
MYNASGSFHQLGDIKMLSNDHALVKLKMRVACISRGLLLCSKINFHAPYPVWIV